MKKSRYSDHQIIAILKQAEASKPVPTLCREHDMSRASFYKTQQHQDVLNLFKEFRGDMASVDEAIAPKLQIDLFIELTKGGGTLASRMFLARKALTVLTTNDTRNLSDGLNAFHVISGNGML